MLTWASVAVGQTSGDGNREARAALRIYTDNDSVTVISPSATMSAPLGSAVNLDVSASVDMVSAASVDVLTQASPTAVSETRLEVGVGAAVRVNKPLVLSARVFGSHENDYDSLRVIFGGRLDLAQKNSVIDVTLSASFDSVGKVTDDSFSESRRGQQATVTFSQLLDPRTVIDFVVDGQRLAGYHANPYREVPVLRNVDNELIWYAENVPDLRLRGALLVRLRRAFDSPRPWHLNAHYRLYADDWGIVSHTVFAQLLTSFANERLLVGLRGRVYTQGAADFYQPYYDDMGAGAPTQLTRDRTLGGMHTVHAAITGEFVPRTDGVRYSASIGGVRFLFHDYPAQAGRDALIASLGVSMPF